jgi:hypothetical protein
MMARTTSTDNTDLPAAPLEPVPQKPSDVVVRDPGRTRTLGAANFLIGFDWTLAIFVVALAFLLASFTVKNTDFWQHLATGRLIADGKSSFGTDPFSFVGEGRTWVNPAWLWDLVIYLVYKAGAGPAVVIFKAATIAVMAMFLLFARPRQLGAWPSILCVSLALIAAAPRMNLQPVTFSYLLLAILLYVLIRVPSDAGGWKLPAIVGGLFWVWANTDSYFFLGPVTLLLFTLGQYVRKDAGVAIPQLWKALLVGAVAATANPHHIHVWTIPPEVASYELVAELGNDGEFGPIFQGLFGDKSLDFTGERDNPTNSITLGLLIVLSLLGAALNFRKTSVGLTLIFLAGFVLFAANLRAGAFWAIAMVPFAAINLAAFFDRVANRPFQEPTVRLLHVGRSLARAALLFGLLLAIGVSYAGWLHPFALQRRWAWEIESNPSLEAGAKQIQEWRENGLIPETARGLNLNADFANYLAWYAPGEKSYFDYRFAFHRPEWKEFAQARRYFRRDGGKEEGFSILEFLKKNQFAYITTASPSRRGNLDAIIRILDPKSKPKMNWTMWSVHGRAATLGWDDSGLVPEASLAKLRFSPATLAFSDQTVPLPVPELKLPNPNRDIWTRFLSPTARYTAEADEILILDLYRSFLLNQAQVRHQANREKFAEGFGSVGGGFATLLNMPMAVPNDFAAASLMMVRTARRSIASSPDNPEGYFMLSKSYADESFPCMPDYRSLVVSATLARAASRLPMDLSEYTGPDIVLDLAQALMATYRPERPSGPMALKIDLSLDATFLAYRSIRRRLELLTDEEDETGAIRKELLKYKEIFEKELEIGKKGVDQALARYESQAAKAPTVLMRSGIARRFGLGKESIDALRKYDLAAELESDKPERSGMAMAVILQLCTELLEVGQIEDASALLEVAESERIASALRTQAGGEGYVRGCVDWLRGLSGQPVGPEAFSPGEIDPFAKTRFLKIKLAIVSGNLKEAADLQAKDFGQAHDLYGKYVESRFGQPISVKPIGFPGLEILDTLMMNPAAQLGSQLSLFAQRIHTQTLTEYVQLTVSEAERDTRLGLTHLELGNVAEARKFFQMAANLPEMPRPVPAKQVAKEYLRIMNEKNR